MKTLSMLKLTAIVAVTLLVLLTASQRSMPRVHADDSDEGCSVATLKGPYGLVFTGEILHLGPIAAVGLANFDGAGHFSLDQTANINGNIVPEHEVGTYSVNSDCTGSSLIAGHPANFVITDGGRQQEVIPTGPGVVATIHFTKVTPGGTGHHGD